VKHAHCDHTLAKQELDFSDSTDLEELICEMFTWATKEPVREQKVMQYEISRGVYEYWK